MPFDVVTRNLDFLLAGIVLTIVVSVASIALGLVIGIVVAAARLSRLRIINLISTVYVELIRNTPLLVQLFILYFGLPELGIRPTAIQAAVIALSVNNGAYLSEIIRGGLQSVPRGQVEAAAAIGLSQRTAYREVLLPLGLRSVVPAITNQFILTILGTSVVSVIGVPELTNQILFIDSRVFRTVELLIFLTLAYAVMTFTVSAVASRVNRRLDRAYAR
jgi:His/Glu/Gln/Arg/opine family amino acid ABC transporter permease subunit